MNQVAEVTVQYVNPPKPGKKWGSIKTSEGVSFFGPPALLHEFQPGEVCKLEWSQKEGSDFKNIVKKIGHTGAPLQPTKQVRQRTNPTDSEQIFVTALLKEFAGAGAIDLTTTSVVMAVKTLRDAYAQTFGGSEAQRRDDMNDEIAF